MDPTNLIEKIALGMGVGADGKVGIDLTRDAINEMMRGGLWIDDKPRSIDTKAMSDFPNRPELDAKLATIEAKMDGRLARIEDRFAGIDRRFDRLETMLEKQKSTAWAAAGATIVAVGGIVFAAYSMGFGAFDSGRETARLASYAETRAAESQAATAAALSEIRDVVADIRAERTAASRPAEAGPPSGATPAGSLQQ